MIERETWMPTYEELMGLGWEMSVMMPSNQSEVWARIFCHLALVAPAEWAVRIMWISETIRLQSVVRLDVERLRVSVSQAEAFSAAYTGSGLGIESTTLLACILYEIERELGCDHAAVLPVRWYRQGLRNRAQIMSQEVTEWNS